MKRLLKNEEGAVIVLAAVIVFTIVMTFMVWIIDVSILFLASNQIRTIAESAALQGASTAEHKLYEVAITETVPIEEFIEGEWVITGYDEIEVVDYYLPYLDIDQETASSSASLIIEEYEDKYLYKSVKLKNIDYQAIAEDNPYPEIPFNYYTSFQVTITADVEKAFPGIWGDESTELTRSSTAKARHIN